MKYLPTTSDLTKQVIISVVSLVAAAWIISRFPNLKNLINSETTN